MKLTKQEINRILEEYRDAINRTKLKEEEKKAFVESTFETLLDYAAQFPEDTEFRYRIRQRFRRVELRIAVAGEKKDPYECGSMAQEREIKRQIRSLKIASSLEMNYVYFRETNYLVFLSPPVKNLSFLRNPVILATLIGIVAGLLCTLLPENVSGFLVQDLASPVLGVTIGLLTAVMGPVIFLSLVTAISAADNIGEISRLGAKIIKRFFLIAIFGSILALLVTFVMFSLQRGQADVDFSLRTLVDMLLAVIPTNLVTPFTENNFPQLLVLGIVLGIALLFLNRRESVINNVLFDLRDWINELLRLVLKITPIIPGLTFFRIFAEGEFDSFIQGWKYIAAFYICMAIGLAVKILKVKIRCKDLRLSLVLRNIFPAAKPAFFSGIEIAAFKEFVEISEGPLGISKNFSSLWIPLNQSMFSPIGPFNCVLGAFFIIHITGAPVSIQFMFILLIMSIQLSMAYPGNIAGNTIIFSALGISTDYVGLFAMFGVFTKNASAAYGIVFRGLEITEAAYLANKIDIEKCNSVSGEPSP